MISIGIDPGLSGGYGILYETTQGKIIAVAGVIPVTTTVMGGKTKKGNKKIRTEIDIRKLSSVMYIDIVNIAKKCNELHRSQDTGMLTCEAVTAMPKQGVVSMFNFGDCFGQIKAMCRLLDGKAMLGVVDAKEICTAVFGELVLVRPQMWKKALFGNHKSSKEEAIKFVEKLYPNCKLIPERCRVPHDGMADAICIAEYRRRLGK